MNTENTPEIAPVPPRRRRRWWKKLGWLAVWIVTLLFLAAVIDGRLGARAWQSALADTRAQGESTEMASIVPPPASDEENFASIPLFRPFFDFAPPSPGPLDVRAGPTFRDPAGKERLDNLKLPPLKETGNWRESQFIDLAACQQELNGGETTGTPSAAVLGGLAKFDPELEALREAAKRPRSRFPIRYEDGVAASLPHVTFLLNFSRITRLRSLAELSGGNVDAAHGDLLLGVALEQALREEPLLISALVRVASLELILQPLWEGLARHQWSEAQLAALEAALQRADFITTYQQAIRGERSVFCMQALDLMKSDPSLAVILTAMNGDSPKAGFLRAIRWFVPTGWIDFNKAYLWRGYGELLRVADPAAHRFFPQVAEHAEEQFMLDAKANRFNPHKELALLVFPAVNATVTRMASAQGTVDLARTAIALERYRLAHGSWPESLAALPKLPTDVVSGGPLQYRVEADGTFTLYSVGWNEHDDGGVVAWKPGTGKRALDWKAGDWVWPKYPPAPAQ